MNTTTDLCNNATLPGIDQVNDRQELKLNLNRGQATAPNIKIDSSESAYNFFMSVWSDEITYSEEFVCLFLGPDKRMIGYKKFFKGGRSGCMVDNSIILQYAIVVGAVSIIVAHNHPSGSAKPSPGDDEITANLNIAAGCSGVELSDHLIITPNGYYSYAEMEQLQEKPEFVLKSDYETIRAKYNKAIIDYYTTLEELNKQLKNKHKVEHKS